MEFISQYRQNLCLLNSVQIVCVAHPGSFPVVTGGFFLEGKVTGVWHWPLSLIWALPSTSIILHAMGTNWAQGQLYLFVTRMYTSLFPTLIHKLVHCSIAFTYFGCSKSHLPIENIQVWLKSVKNNGYCTWRPMYIYDNILLNSS